jgi:hypothetical protein
MKAEFCKNLKAMIKDEAKANSEYSRLMGSAPMGMKRYADIVNIRTDERSHKKTLESIEKEYCGGK